MTTDSAVLRVLVGFSAFGKDYQTGEVIPPEHPNTWPKGTLARRLQNGFVSYEAPSEYTPPPAPVEEAKSADELSSLTKEQLRAYAKDQFNVDLDKSMTKDDMATTILKLEEDKQ